MHAPFRITGHVFTALDCVVVEIAEGGCIGRGEAAGVYYLNDTPERPWSRFSALAPEIEAGLDRGALQHLLPPGGARNAVDCALWDLECKLSRQSIWAKTGVNSRPLTTCQTIGVLPTPADSAAAAAALEGYKLLKLKLDHDGPIERVRAVRAARPDARLIVDANQGFTLSTAAGMPARVRQVRGRTGRAAAAARRGRGARGHAARSAASAPTKAACIAASSIRRRAATT